MKTLTLFFFTILPMSAIWSQQAMRDSTYAVDSTASNITIRIDLTAQQAAALYRVFGVNWQEECRSTLVAVSRRDDSRDEWDKIQALSLTNAQKRAVADDLGIRNPRIVQVLKRKAVPALER